MDVYSTARHYYQDFTPPLWDKSRLDRLVEAGKLTEQERDEIIGKETDDENP